MSMWAFCWRTVSCPGAQDSASTVWFQCKPDKVWQSKRHRGQPPWQPWAPRSSLTVSSVCVTAYAWKSLTDKVQEARSNARLKQLSFAGNRRARRQLSCWLLCGGQRLPVKGLETLAGKEAANSVKIGTGFVFRTLQFPPAPSLRWPLVHICRAVFRVPGVNGLRMLGIIHDTVVFLIEQLYGAKHCHNYKFRFHKPEEANEPPLNPHGSARAEVHLRQALG